MVDSSEDRGQNFLVSCEGVLFNSGVFRLHRCFFKFPIVREGVYPLGDFTRVEMQNWAALLGLEQGVKVRKTTSSWIVHVETLYGRSPGELVTLAKKLADRVSQGLTSKYGCVLGQGEINKRHELGVDDPVAQLLNQYFTVSTPKRVIDDSPGEDEGEIDHLGRDAAVEYLLMPERLKKVEGQLDSVSYDLEKINGNLRKLTDALGKLCDLEVGNSAQSNMNVSNDNGGKDYAA